MTRPVVDVRTDASLQAVAEALTHNDVTAVLVVDGVGRLIGVVSEADLVRKVARPGSCRTGPAAPADGPLRR
ncbi:CBS domain-containing protein [Streptomyces violaceoruber]